jgi:hypothetical protein
MPVQRGYGDASTGAISQNVHLACRGYLCPLALDGLELMKRLALHTEGNFGIQEIGDLKKRSAGLYITNLTEFMLKRGAGRGI